MKVEKNVSMHSHTFKLPCKRQIVTDTKSRNASHLPFKETHPVLYDHFDLFKNQLEQLFKNLKNDKEILKKYNDVITKQLTLGIIKEVPEDSKVEEGH